MSERTVKYNVGKISRDSAIVTIEWKVENFFNIPKEIEYITSPEFQFLDGKWSMILYPNGVTENTNGWIGLYLDRLHSLTDGPLITCILGIKKEDGAEYVSKKGRTFFIRNLDTWGYSMFIRRSSLKENKNQIASQGTVTFFCTLRVNVNESKEVASQTTFSEGVENLSQNLKELLNEQDGDIVLNVKDEEFRAHKAILRVRSSVFKSVIRCNMKEGNSGVIDITDCNPSAFGDFLHFLYCGKVAEFSVDRMFDLYFVSDKYDVAELKSMCVEYIIDKMSKDTFFDALTLALKHNESTVLKYATNYFIENTKEIVETAQWLTFQKENPVEARELILKMLNKVSPE